MRRNYQTQPVENAMRHNYFARIVGLVDRGKLPRGQATEVEVQHDDWCLINAGGYCNCMPEIYLEGKKL